MATAPAPVKSQPLHNFSLPFLKWGGTGKNHTNTNNHQRSRRVPDHASEPDSEPDSRPHRLGSRTARNRFGVASSSSQRQPPLSSNNEADDDAGEKKQDVEDELDAAVGVEETVQKPWNLRPRKPIRGAFEIGNGGSRNNNNNQNSNNGGELQETVNGESPSVPKSLRLRDTNCGEKKEKRKFWIALSKEEIEEDIFVMTGSRPNRRPKKRPKNVQKQMDNVFPGLWLVGITADAYRVADTPTKR